MSNEIGPMQREISALRTDLAARTDAEHHRRNAARTRAVRARDVRQASMWEATDA